jgi:hypothetical protein
MKEEIVNYIEKLLMSEEPLTDAQVRIVAYWELVDFQCDRDEQGLRCRNALNKFLEVYNNEMSALV